MPRGLPDLVTRVVHVPLGEVGDLGFREHGRPKLGLPRVLRGDEGIFRPIREDHEAMAPQNISIGVTGHVRSELQIGRTVWIFCVLVRNFFGESVSWSPQHHKESPQRINPKNQLQWEQNRNVVSALMASGPGWRANQLQPHTAPGGFVLEGVREDYSAT